MTRRSLLRRLLLLVGIDVAGLTGCVSGRGIHPVSESVLVAPEEPSTSGILSTADLEDLVAFAEVVVEGRALAPAERGHIVEHIAARTRQSPEYLSLYRTTARTLERLTGRRVASLELRERVELAARHRLGDQRVLPGEDLGPMAEELRTVRKRAARDLIEAYYRSPAGWAVVDYTAFPGQCGNLTRYTRAER